MKRAFAYVRVSKEDPLDEKWGADSQRQRIIEYCAFKKWQLVDIAEDRNVSGVTPFAERPGWSKIASQFAKGDIVIVSELTRFGRRLSMTLLMLEDLQERGMEIASLENDLDTTTPVGRLVLHILLSFAAFERELLIARLKAAHAEIHRQGKALGCRAPLGYDYDIESRQWSVNEDESELVNRIFDLKLAGYGFQAIAKKLTEEGFSTKRGGSWRTNTIKRVIESRRYIGERDYNDQVLPMNIPAIVERDMWEMAQASIRRHGYQAQGTYELSGLLHCAECGHVLYRVRRWKDGVANGQADWRCPDCGGVAIRDSIALPAVESALFTRLDPNSDEYKAVVKEARTTLTKGQGRLATIHKRLGALERKQSRILDELARDDTTLTRDAFQRKNGELQGQIDELTQAAQKLEDDNLLSKRPRVLGDIRADWQTLDVTDKQATFKDFIERVDIVSPNGIRGADRVVISWRTLHV